MAVTNIGNTDLNADWILQGKARAEEIAISKSAFSKPKKKSTFNGRRVIIIGKDKK